ncbi:MAG: hypothetical protein ABW171_12745 [Steroidobacter sp.]
MRRRHLQLLSLWILPLLLARALIPTGFMLSVDAGSLQLVFCPAVQTTGSKQQLDSSMHHSGMHHAGAADADTASHDDDNAPCPFSLVASAAPGDVPYVSDSASGPSDERFDFISAPTVRVGPVRTAHIRGPPAFA